MCSTSQKFSKIYSDPIWKFTLRFGTGVTGELDSMKIYGALLSAVKILYPEHFDEFYQRVKEGRIKVSSPMPEINGKLYVFKPNLNPKEEIEDRKAFKNARFVSMDIARDALNNGGYTSKHIEKIINDINKFSALSLEVPKVAVSRLNRKTSIYYLTERFLYEIAILVKVPEKFRTVVSTAMRFLGDRGISKKISCGLGSFKIVKKEEFKESVSNGEYHLLISRFAPASHEIKEINFNESYYDVRLIVGRTRTGESFRQRIITEGSVLKFETPPVGKIIEMGDERYRYSACLTGMFI